RRDLLMLRRSKNSTCAHVGRSQSSHATFPSQRWPGLMTSVSAMRSTPRLLLDLPSTHTLGRYVVSRAFTILRFSTSPSQLCGDSARRIAVRGFEVVQSERK